MSLLPSHFEELQIIDAVLGNFINAKLNFNESFFYIPNKHNAQFIANTFDVDITGLKPFAINAILQSPMLSKTRLGTQGAMKEALKTLNLKSQIQTIQQDAKLRPFEFSLKVNPQIDEVFDGDMLSIAKTMAESIKPLRSSLAGIDVGVEMILQPSINSSLKWRL